MVACWCPDHRQSRIGAYQQTVRTRESLSADEIQRIRI
jgi:hypothetical protein